MVDGIYNLPDGATPKRVMIYISAECCAAVDRWQQQHPEAKSRVAAIDALIHLGLAETALRSMRRRRKVGQ